MRINLHLCLRDSVDSDRHVMVDRHHRDGLHLRQNDVKVSGLDCHVFDNLRHREDRPVQEGHPIHQGVINDHRDHQDAVVVSGVPNNHRRDVVDVVVTTEVGNHPNGDSIADGTEGDVVNCHLGFGNPNVVIVDGLSFGEEALSSTTTSTIFAVHFLGQLLGCSVN